MTSGTHFVSYAPDLSVRQRVAALHEQAFPALQRRRVSSTASSLSSCFSLRNPLAGSVFRQWWYGR